MLSYGAAFSRDWIYFSSKYLFSSDSFRINSELLEFRFWPQPQRFESLAFGARIVYVYVSMCVCVISSSTEQGVSLHFLTPVILLCRQMAIRWPNIKCLRERMTDLTKESNYWLWVPEV